MEFARTAVAILHLGAFVQWMLFSGTQLRQPVFTNRPAANQLIEAKPHFSSGRMHAPERIAIAGVSTPRMMDLGSASGRLA